jgi:hypothetical protein
MWNSKQNPQTRKKRVATLRKILKNPTFEAFVAWIKRFLRIRGGRRYRVDTERRTFL